MSLGFGLSDVTRSCRCRSRAVAAARSVASISPFWGTPVRVLPVYRKTAMAFPPARSAARRWRDRRTGTGRGAGAALPPDAPTLREQRRVAADGAPPASETADRSRSEKPPPPGQSAYRDLE